MMGLPSKDEIRAFLAAEYRVLYRLLLAIETRGLTPENEKDMAIIKKAIDKLGE